MAESLSRLREPSIKAEKGRTALGSCQMKGIREVHPRGHPIQGGRGQGGILQRDLRESCHGPEGCTDLSRRIAIRAAQDTLCLQQDCRTNEDLMAVDQRSRPRGLLGMVSCQVAD